MPRQLSVLSPVQHLTVAQLSVRLNLSTDHLRRAILGQPTGIPAIKMSNGPRAQWRIRLHDVEQWEASRMVCYDAAPKRRRGR